MTKRALPELKAFEGREGVDFELTPSALKRWNPDVRAAASDSQDQTISVYGYIGETWDGSGVTAARIAGALRAIGGKDVVVNVNSPGGSAFEGIAIYNLLRAHPHNVTVRVVGLAASAASIIAMAGDRIEMGAASFLMIHNVLMLAVGNRNDLRAAADTMDPIDRALADLYAERTGNTAREIAKMMDAETWLGGNDAIDQGFADALMTDAISSDPSASGRGAARARAQLQSVLAKAGYSRSQQRDLLKEFTAAMPSAGVVAMAAMPSAGVEGSGTKPTTTKDEKMDILELKTKHPEIAAALVKEGHEAGHEAGFKAGADAERARVQAVEAQVLPGHEQLINSLKFDGKTSGAEAAVAVLNAERVRMQARLSDLHADGAAVSGVQAVATPAVASAAAAAGTPEQRWEADADLRAEYGQDKASFLAYEKARAAGRVKILGNKVAV